MGMFEFFTVVAGVGGLLLLLLGPLWLVFHYIDRWKRMNVATGKVTSQEADALREAAEKLEMRVDSLEKLLDAQAAGWRDR